MQKRNHKLQCLLGWMKRGLVFLPVLFSPTLVMGQAGQWCSSPYLVEWPDTTPVWSFCWTPPSSSSGLYGSGIEISQAFYRAPGTQQWRLVFYKAHVPIQRVKYVGSSSCGPYRDWHDEEHPFQCLGTINGKACFGTAKTICDVNGPLDGAGNFTGVAIDKQTDNVALTSVMRAGWYRYVQAWHFYQDGTIKPRVRMVGSAHPCTGESHTHHVYWRFDFDLDGYPKDAIQESPLNWTTLNPETSRIKNSGASWRLLDTGTGLSWTLIPGATDGVADSFSTRDLWAFRYHSGQIGDSATASADKLTSYLTQESINSQDDVAWYVAHGFHQGGDNACHVVGPDLKRQ